MSTQGSCMLVQLTESPASPAVWKCPVLALMVDRIQADAVIYFQCRICLSRPFPPPPPPFSFTLLSILSLHWSFVFEAEAFHRHWACLAAVSKCI